MQNFTYFVPTRVMFGRNAEEQAGEAVRAEGEEQAALAGIAAAEAYFQSLGLPVTFGASTIGVVPEAELELLALGCSWNRGRSIGNFCPLDHNAMLEVYRTANR